MAEERLIVSNTSPLINFSEIGRLDLLEALPGRVCITPGVKDELLAKAGLFPLAAKAVSSGIFELRTPGDQLLVRSLASSVHLGEAECLALGMENPGSLLILDDLSARAVATANGLTFTGTLGILAMAKSRGHLAALAPVLQELRLRARFWINSRLEQSILRDVGEAP